MSARSIAVFCGSSTGGLAALADTADELGRSLALGGHRLVYGGGRVGLMGVVADAALTAGGEVVGFIPESLVEREVQHTGLTELVVTDTMHSRKAGMADRSDGFIVLPGGYGTLDESLEILTWNQIGLIAKPLVFLDVQGYYDDLFRFFDRAVDAGLVNDVHRGMAHRAASVDEAIALATGPPPTRVSKWDDPTVKDVR